LTLDIETKDLSEVLNFLRNKFKKLFPNKVFDYFFLDEDFDKQYRKEEQTAKIFGVFAFLGILFASLGLIGLAAFTANQRTKEIGIRKVLGASIKSIVSLLTKEFFLLVLTANIVAWPMAYYVMNRWFESFAYRIDIGLEAFFLAGLIAVFTALCLILYQAFKVAQKNPVDSLKFE